MTRSWGTRVDCVVSLRQQIYVVKDGTLKKLLFECLHKTNVHQSTTIEIRTV